jgi:hypothetical protein
MKKLLSLIIPLLLWASIADAQLVPRQTVEPGAGLIYCTSTDLSDAYTCPTATPIITAYGINQPVLLTTATSNTGAASVNIRAIGAITILAHDGSTLANNAIVAGRPYLLIYNGTNFLLYPGDTGGSGTLSGLTNNRILKALGSTDAIDSNCLDTGTSIDCGDVSGNHHRETFTTPTAAPHDHNWPAVSGDIAHTTGATVTNNLAKFDASGRIVDSGVAAPAALNKVVQIEVFGPGVTTATGDGKAFFRVPSSLNGTNLVVVTANVLTAGTTGTINVDIARCAAAATGNVCSGTVADMLSTNLTIDSGENSSSNAAAAAVIDTANDDVATGQIIRIDVDGVHTTPALGLLVNLEFN